MIAKPVVLIVDDDRIPTTLAVIRCLGIQNECDVHVLTLSRHEFPVFRYSKYIKSFRRITSKNDEQSLEAIKNTITDIKADVVVPIRERTIMLLSERSEELKKFVQLPLLPAPATLEMVKNKWQLYIWLYENGFVSEKPERYADLLKDDSRIDSISYPIVIKPFLEAGGTGITVIMNAIEFRNFKPKPGFNAEELLIQPYFPGYDIDFSGLISEGRILAHTMQKGISGNEKFVYSRHIQFVHDELLLETVSEIFKILNYSGVAHLDFRFDTRDQDYKLVDFNPRYWRTIMGSLDAGINFPWLALKQPFHQDTGILSYQDRKYLAEMNPLRILLAGGRFNQSDFWYGILDPLPYMAGVLVYFKYLLKKIKK